jgi:alanine racemase
VELPYLNVEGIYTHFSSADEADRSYTHCQLEAFRKVVEELSRAGVDIPVKHAANSAGILNVPESWLDMVRPGIMLYGYYPSAETSKRVSLRPALSWKTRLAMVKSPEPGSSISYGRTYRTGEGDVIGTLPVGYADGYSRLLSNKGSVLAGERKVPVVGRVCMDQVMVNLKGLNNVQPGDEVVLLGKQGEASLTGDDLANWLGTISYEVLTNIAGRVPRGYWSNGKLLGFLR